ncbi:hypothetical protein E2C01_013346 [Portunus trituberculatus]|uniref:Uncharacterized protein n=1 Tax=Portunus trituberculatus TaxID=210409 RepID=A0A5B7DGS2_PORTR|nr:hypothetical protein [Portunus trituberculatus]
MMGDFNCKESPHPPIVNPIKANLVPHVHNGNAWVGLQRVGVSQWHNEAVEAVTHAIWSVQLGKHETM